MISSMLYSSGSFLLWILVGLAVLLTVYFFLGFISNTKKKVRRLLKRLKLRLQRGKVVFWGGIVYRSSKAVQVEYMDQSAWISHRFIESSFESLQICRIKMPLWRAAKKLNYDKNHPGCCGHYSILRRGIEIWNQWRQDFPDEKVVLSETNLSNLDLQHANLSGSSMKGTRLKASNLSHCDLRDIRFLMPDQLAEADLLLEAKLDTELYQAVYRINPFLFRPKAQESPQNLPDVKEKSTEAPLKEN